MLLGVLAMLVAGTPLPPECEPPATRDVSGLKTFAQASGMLSAGLDSVATWCFDTGGTSKSTGADCQKALASCRQAKDAVTADLRALLRDALGDLGRPYLGARYVPKRSGLDERPSEGGECQATARSELFAAAQARMDLARLASMVQNEYANYKTWLFAEGLKCSQVVASRRPKVDPTRKGMSVDSPVDTSRAGQQQVPMATSAPGNSAAAEGAPTGRVPPPPGATGALTTSGAGTVSLPAGSVGNAIPGKTPSQTGVQLAAAAPTSGASIGPIAGAPNQGVATTTNTTPSAGGATTADTGRSAAGRMSETAAPAPSETSTRLKKGEASGPRASPDGGVAVSAEATGTLDGLVSTFARTDASVGAQTLLGRWRRYAETRAQLELDRDYVAGFSLSRELRDCHCVKLHPSEVVRRLEQGEGVAQLEADDAKNTACEQCLLNAYSAWRRRADQQCTLLTKLTPYEIGVLERSDDGNGLPPRCLDAVRPAPRDAGVVISVKAAQVDAGRATAPTLTSSGPGVVAASERNDGYVRAQDYAPVPLREDGRLYVRLFMSSACAAEVLPGPLQARTGDLLLMPLGATAVSVSSPCGGLAEVYFGREATPRVSELFGRNQPLVLQFKAQ